jgi:phthiocerol/phenolphthiocerol synthesis type-I polyketide synthase A
VSQQEAFAAWEHVDRYDIAQAVLAPTPPVEFNGHRISAPIRAWTQMTVDDLLAELRVGLRAVLARELRLPEAELDLDRPFAELGLNSVMAMSIRREAEQLAGIELSATMLWNHPTVESLARYLANRLSPQQDFEDRVDTLPDSSNNVLDALFDHVESVP